MNTLTSWIKNYWFLLITVLIIVLIWTTNTNQTIFFKLNALHTLLPDNIWEKINFITYSKTYILPITLLVITLLFRRKKFFNVLLLIIFYYSLFNYLKDFFHVARPHALFDLSTFYWLHPGLDTSFQPHGSFPSGHTCNTAVFVFTLSYFFAQNKPWLRTLLILILMLVMLTRIATGWHFPLDVLISAIIGYALTKIFLNCMTLHVKSDNATT